MHVTLASDDALIMDMDAGIEHLGRATTQSMDALVVVVDGGTWSVQTAHRVRELAGDIGIKNLAAVVNRVTERTDLAAVETALEGIPILGTLPFDDRLGGGVVQTDDDQQMIATDVLTELAPRVEQILQQLFTQSAAS